MGNLIENLDKNGAENAYLPLFRKYRPQSFKDVIGQEFTVRALSNAIKLNKIANAYLFCGPRGTGKTSSARIFAKSLNCAEGPTIEPCQKCQSCLDVTNASGLDVIEIDAATNRGIDDAKELINKVQYAPMNGKYKIFIIDEVHMLSKEAFNALLKTFEEPPENVIFILATTEPHKVIETIVSRCQRFDFRRITIDDIVKRLREISDIEKINITDDGLYAIAKNVSGGMRDSLALLDQASILGIEKPINQETIETLIGKLTFDVQFALLVKITAGDIKSAIDDVEKIYEKGSEPRNFLENFIEFLRNVVLVLSSENIEETMTVTLFSAENINKIRMNSNFSQNKILKILDKVIEFYKEVKTAANPYLWAELAVINVCAIDLYTATNAKFTQKEAFAPSQQTAVTAQTQQIQHAVIKKETEIQEQKTPDVSAEKGGEPLPQEAGEEKSKKTAQKINTENEKQGSDDFAETHVNLSENNANTSDVTENSEIGTHAENSAVETASPAEIWGEIVNNIDSILPKSFYSGTGKLINIENGKITLGFVNENVITQAKSENKFNPLMKAVRTILGENASVEFVTVNKDTKIIETKINLKTQESQRQMPPEIAPMDMPLEVDIPPMEDDFMPPPPTETPAPATGTAKQEDKEKYKKKWSKKSAQIAEKVDYSSYTKATREMLETFGGRVVE